MPHCGRHRENARPLRRNGHTPQIRTYRFCRAADRLETPSSARFSAASQQPPPRLRVSCLVLHALRAATTARPHECSSTSPSSSARASRRRRRPVRIRARSAPSAAVVRSRPHPAARRAATRSREGSNEVRSAGHREQHRTRSGSPDRLRLLRRRPARPAYRCALRSCRRHPTVARTRDRPYRPRPVPRCAAPPCAPAPSR